MLICPLPSPIMSAQHLGWRRGTDLDIVDDNVALQQEPKLLLVRHSEGFGKVGSFWLGTARSARKALIE